MPAVPDDVSEDKLLLTSKTNAKLEHEVRTITPFSYFNFSLSIHRHHTRYICFMRQSPLYPTLSVEQYLEKMLEAEKSIA